MNHLQQLKELEKLGNKLIRLAAESWDEHWKILISTIMSARTRDEVTIVVADKLFKKYPTIEKLAEAELKELENIIKSVNFYRNKSKNILNCAKTLAKEHNNIVPLNFEALLKLPGVGRKTANVFLSEIGKAAIGVDTHLAYCSQKLGWSKNKNPHKIEEDLKKLFPRKLWKKINPIAVRFGKTYNSKKKKDEILEKINNR